MKNRIGIIIGAELKKLIHSNLFRICFFVLFLLNFIILFLSVTSDPLSKSAYREFKSDYEKFGTNEQERLSYAKEFCVKRQVMKQYQNELDAGERVVFCENSLDIATSEGYSETWYESVKKEYLSGIPLCYGKSLEEETDFLTHVLKEIKQSEEYPDYIKEIQSYVKDHSEIQLFVQNQSQFTKNDLEKMSRDYKQLESVQPHFAGTKGLSFILGSVRLDVCPLILLIVICALLFLEDKRIGISKLYRSMKNGRKGVLMAKTAVMLFSSIFIVLVFWGINLVCVWKWYGAVSLNAPVQSVLGFKACTMEVSIGQYLIYYLLVKMAALFVIGCLCNLLAICAQNYVMYFLGVSIAGSVSSLCAFAIPKYTYFSGLRYLNLVSYLEGTKVSKEYMNFNILGHPLDSALLCHIVVAAFAIALFFFSIIIFGKCEKVYHNYNMWFHRINWRRKKVNGSVFAHESYKLFVGSKVAVLLVILLLLLTYATAHQQNYVTEEEYYYRIYMKHLEGKPTQEKEEYIQKETERIEDVKRQIQQLETKFAKGKISKEQKQEAVGYLQLAIRGEAAFERVKQRAEYINLHEQSHYAFVYEDGWNCIFGLNREGVMRDRWNALICIFVLVISIGGTFTSEYETGMCRVLKAAYRGRRYTVIRKILLSEATLLLIMVIVYAQDFIMANEKYGIHSLLEKAGSIPALVSRFGCGGSILLYCLVLFCIRFLGCSIIVVVNCVISRFTKNTLKNILILLLLFAFPVVLDLFGIVQINWCSLNWLFYGNDLLNLSH